MNSTELAQYAAQAGPSAADRPTYDSSPNGLVFRAGLWARSAGVTVYEAHMSRGYTVVVNRKYKVNLKDDAPVVTLV